MDQSGPRSGTTTPNSGSDSRFERPLPPIPYHEPLIDIWDDGDSAGPSNPTNSRHEDMTDIYDQVVAGRPGIAVHNSDNDLRGISFSTEPSDQVSRSPRLSGVSSGSASPSFLIDDHSSSRRTSPEISRGTQRGTGGINDLSGLSLREFLGNVPSTPEGRPSKEHSPRYSPRHPNEEYLERAREQYRNAPSPQGRIRPMVSQYVSAPENDASTSGGNTPLLSHTSPSQIDRRRPTTPTEFVVPRWQPDAEVTFCPICNTQFSRAL